MRQLLEQQLQSELDLPRIVGSITSGADPAKVRVGEIARTGDGHDAVAAEIRRVKVRVVENVEEFGPELQVDSFLDRERLKDREVQSTESGSRHLS